MLQRLCLEKKQELCADDDSKEVPDVAAVIQDLVLNLFVNTYSHAVLHLLWLLTLHRLFAPSGSYDMHNFSCPWRYLLYVTLVGGVSSDVSRSRCTIYFTPCCSTFSQSYVFFQRCYQCIPIFFSPASFRECMSLQDYTELFLHA